MGSLYYEPIKNCIEDNNEEGRAHPYRMNKATGDNDVEMALQISEPRYATVFTNGERRLVSLDVFRGLTVALMILVDNAGGIIPEINHSPWNGLTLADFVMPFFLFIVGVSLALTYKKLSCRVVATRKAILWALKLLALGLFLQGGFFHGLNDLTYGVDIKHIRWMGILQRIAVAYLVTALCEIWLKSDDTVNSRSSLLWKYRCQGILSIAGREILRSFSALLKELIMVLSLRGRISSCSENMEAIAYLKRSHLHERRSKIEKSMKNLERRMRKLTFGEYATEVLSSSNSTKMILRNLFLMGLLKKLEKFLGVVC